MTALMVKLGWLDLVRDIVATLSRQERADVVSQVGLHADGLANLRGTPTTMP